MFTIKKFNRISDEIYLILKEEEYRFITEGDSYQGAIVRSADLRSEVFPKELLAIARAGAGVNNIPVEACSEKGIAVFNTPGANANAVKELVICALLLSCRKIVSGIEWAASQTADVDKNMEKAKNEFSGGEIAGKTLGVVGLGAVGVMVANAASALGMEVLGCDPYLSVKMALKLSSSVNVVKSTEEIFRRADFISLHVPENSETKGMINKDSLSLMKPGAVMLNFARGGLVKDEDILSALDSGKLARYVTDFPNDRIVRHRGVIATPHLGASTPEAEENCARMAATSLRDYLKTGNIHGSVNLPACEMPAPEGFRICIINRNITNMIRQMTAALAAEGINIVHMVNRSRGDWAYTVFDVEKRPGSGLISAIEAVEGVARVRVIEPE